MPYNTRRKSLNLSTLGIQLPSTSRAHRPSASKTNNDLQSSPQQSPHPTKRVKHSHSPSQQSIASQTSVASPQSPPPSGHPSAAKVVGFAVERPRSGGRNAYQHTPPPSPGAADEPGIDFEGINDDIVSGVVEQLEKTGNRPHLIKELASVLSRTNDSVAGYVSPPCRDLSTSVRLTLNSSANPAALLSSRLAAYMRRPSWTPQSPCLIAKELIPVHPRKVFYYLTTKPRQALPASATEPTLPTGPVLPTRAEPKRIISPSLSDVSQDDDEHSASLEPSHRRRTALSPSPEIDLSLDLDGAAPAPHPDAELDFPTPATPAAGGPFGLHRTNSRSREGSDSERELGLHRRAESPPLEGDEREFTATARGMRLRGMSLDEQPSSLPDLPKNSLLRHNDDQPLETAPKTEPSASSDPAGPAESEEEKARKAAATLFGNNSHHPPPQHHSEQNGGLMFSSPLFRPVVGSPAIVPAAGSSRALPAQARDAKIRDTDGDTVMLGASVLGDSVFGLGWDISRPEHVDLEELDDLFDAC